MTKKNFILTFALALLAACSSGPSETDQTNAGDPADEFNLDDPTLGDTKSEEKIGDDPFGDTDFGSAPDPSAMPEMQNTPPPSPPSNVQSYVPPPPPTFKPQQGTSSMSIGRGKFMTTSNRCGVHARPDGNSQVHNYVDMGKRLWVEKSSSEEWVTVQRKAGPAYMRIDCF